MPVTNPNCNNTHSEHHTQTLQTEGQYFSGELLCDGHEALNDVCKVRLQQVDGVSGLEVTTELQRGPRC